MVILHRAQTMHFVLHIELRSEMHHIVSGQLPSR